jgi:hypothetical protein
MSKVLVQVGCRRISAILMGLLAWSAIVCGQGAPQISVSPSIATLLIGQTQHFRVVDAAGHMQRNVSWSISEMGGLDSQTGDELVVTARHAGVFKITGSVNGLSADGVVRVMEGNSLPPGTAKWSDAEPPGCKLVKTVPATPNDGGADMLALSTCADGQYITAYSKDGIQLSRRKAGASSPRTPSPGAMPAAAGLATGPSAGTHLDLNSSSVCDALAIGTEQEKARELLKSNNRSFSTEGANGQVWVVDETGSECRLWFDDKSVLVKKRKTLTAE